MATPLAKEARSRLVCRPLPSMVTGCVLETMPAISLATPAGSLL